MHKGKERVLENVYSACEEEGSFIPLAKIDYDLIKTMLDIALIDLTSVKEWVKNAPEESGQWNAIFKLHYDVLHILAEAFLLFDKLKSRTHECLFTYLCSKHQELKFDWKFCELIRTKRNRSLYYGKPVNYEDWKAVEQQIEGYIDTLRKTIEKKLNLS